MCAWGARSGPPHTTELVFKTRSHLCLHPLGTEPGTNTGTAGARPFLGRGLIFSKPLTISGCGYIQENVTPEPGTLPPVAEPATLLAQAIETLQLEISNLSQAPKTAEGAEDASKRFARAVQSLRILIREARDITKSSTAAAAGASDEDLATALLDSPVGFAIFQKALASRGMQIVGGGKVPPRKKAGPKKAPTRAMTPNRQRVQGIAAKAMPALDDLDSF